MISVNSDRIDDKGSRVGVGGGSYCPQFPVKDAVKKWLKQASENIVIIFSGVCVNP